MTPLPGDLFGDLLDHVTHEFRNRIQPVLGGGSPGETALRHLLCCVRHAGLAPHATHHLILELIEKIPRNLRTAKFPRLLLGQTANHATQK